VQVGLRLADRGLLLVIADDGRGFCPDTVAHGHFGLQTMRERAESVGGWLAVDSGLGGTRLEAWLPRVPAG
jgi:signal transduction histidine kinase